MTRALRILVVDDEPPIRRLLRTSFAAAGYDTIEAEDVSSAMRMLRAEEPDAVILDLGLPKQDGFDFIRIVRETALTVPIVVLSSRSDEAGKVRALDMGADDYVTKPFGTDELLARIRVAVRHRLHRDGEHAQFETGDLKVDLVRRTVTVRATEMKLTPREYDLLRVLIAHAGKVLTHRFILREVWGGDTDVQYLRIYVRALRQKIESDPERPQLILTEQGVGYRLRAPD
jgi:two-component system KDP operon response regulator KdpE